MQSILYFWVMENNIFEKLVANIKTVTANDLDRIGFESEYRNYSLMFVAEEDDNYNINFLEIYNSKLKKLYELTDTQMNVLKILVNNEINYINEKLEDEKLRYN